MSEKHMAPDNLKKYALDIIRKYKKDCIVFITVYSDRRKRYFKCRYMYGAKSDLCELRVDKQNTSLYLEALKHVLPITECKDCKLIVVSSNESNIKKDALDPYNKIVWKQVYDYLCVHNVKINAINELDPGETHSIIKDTKLFKEEQSARKKNNPVPNQKIGIFGGVFAKSKAKSKHDLMMADMNAAHRILSGHRESDGFGALADKGRLDLTLEALAVKKQFTALFSDEEANNALTRLLAAGHF